MSNRERKYRAWHPELKEMVYSHDEIVWDKREFFLMCFPVGFSHYPQDNKWIIMDWTGLKDKNGKDIYEGDILHCHEYDSSDTGHRIVQTFKNAVVGFSDGNYYYYPKGNMRMPHQLLMYAYQPEIIGNIHEHAHLIPQQPTTENNT